LTELKGVIGRAPRRACGEKVSGGIIETGKRVSKKRRLKPKQSTQEHQFPGGGKTGARIFGKAKRKMAKGKKKGKGVRSRNPTARQPAPRRKTG